MSVNVVGRLSARAADADTVRYTLTAEPFAFAPLQGTEFAALAYNGSIPGPVLRVRDGQNLRVNFVNRTHEASTIHWHGFVLPNAMDGVPDVTQPAVGDDQTFTYAFTPGPTGTRWYHSHTPLQALKGLFGMIVVEDPRDEHADVDLSIVFHDVPRMSTIDEAMKGVSRAPMVDPPGSPELLAMAPDDKMGDEVGYIAHCINGASYPKTKPIAVQVGQKVRLRILNANLTQTRYVRLAGHALRLTHADGNLLPQPLEVDILRIGVAERYDAWFEVTKPGAWLLQGISADPMVFEQAVVIHTPGLEGATPLAARNSLSDARVFSYELASGLLSGGSHLPAEQIDVKKAYVLGGGDYGSDRWTMNGKIYPDTEKIVVRSGNRIEVRFTNKSDMHHPMHLHGHNFDVVEIDGRILRSPISKDTALVNPNGGTMTWRFTADSPAGRWLLHCHNDIHMMDGLMTEVVYE